MPVSGDYRYETTSLATRTAQLGGESEVTEERTIVRTDNAVIDILTEEEALVDAGILRVPDEPYALSPPVGMSWVQFTRYRGHTLEYAQDKFTVIARMRWSTMYVVDPRSTTSVLYALPAQVDYVGRSRNTKVYRTGWSVAPPAGSDASADITGTAVAGGFQGKDWIVSQVAIRMRFAQDSSSVGMDTAATTLSNYIGTTNSATFLGFPANSLICEGLSMSKTGNGTEWYEVTFEFLYDKWYHHEQIATSAEDGNPRITSSGPAEVKWKRLPRTSTDFNNIYGGDALLRDLAENGWWQ